MANSETSSTFSTIFSNIPSPAERLIKFDQKPLVLFGAGTLGTAIAKSLASFGQNVVCYADETQEKWYQKKNNLPILPPKEAFDKYPNAVFIVCIFLPNHSFLDTQAKLKAIGIEDVISFYEVLYAFPDTLLPLYFFSQPKEYSTNQYLRLHDALNDQISRETLSAFLQLILHGDFSQLRAQPVFKEKMISPDNSTFFIDAGAYNGDTLNAYIHEYGASFEEYIALEPDRYNYAKLTNAVAELPAHVSARIQLMPVALTSHDRKISFNETQTTASCISEKEGAQDTYATCVDTICRKIESSNICIKMDIEGAEMDALIGAEKTIIEKKPQMMICTYHKPHDTLKFFEWIRARRSDYKFYLRSHGSDGADLVLYCL